jgi:hypothetical protein
VSDDVVQREELRAAAAARAELGDEMEPAVIDAFVERIERRLGAMGISVPLFITAAIFTGLAGVIAVCVALVAIAAITAR